MRTVSKMENEPKLPDKASIDVAHFHIKIIKRLDRAGQIQKFYGEPKSCTLPDCQDLITHNELEEMVVYRRQGADGYVAKIEREWRTYALDMIDYISQREYDRGYSEGYEDGTDDR